jgi:DNA-binding HxlR family transcriptional regulator
MLCAAYQSGDLVLRRSLLFGNGLGIGVQSDAAGRMPEELLSEKMLIQDLRQMEANNLLVRKDYKEVPPRVEYSITPFGRALGKSLIPLCAWGVKNRKRVLAKEIPQKTAA